MDAPITNVSAKISLIELGGRSTEFYYQQLRLSLAENDIQRVTINFERLNYHLPNDFTYLVPKLEQALDVCDPNRGIIIPNVTLHETLDQHCARSYRDLCIYHPLQESIKALKEEEQEEVVLFASSYSMQAAYIKTFFAMQNISLRAPELLDRQFLDIFRIAVYSNLETRQQTDQFFALLEKYSVDSAVLVACTELSLKLANSVTNNRLYDTARLQIESALQTI